jgi:hypothetical protein
MARGGHASTVKIQTPVPVVIHGIPKKNTWSGAVTEFVSSSGRLIGEAKTSKNSKMTVIGGGAQEGVNEPLV